MKSASYTKKYWFALGYHHRMLDNYDSPNEGMCVYIQETLNIDIMKEYHEGRKAADKDLKNGNF
jgi:hypothetical protein